MEQKKQESSEGKGYSLASNLLFALKEAWKWKKSAVFLLFMQMVAQGADSYVPLIVTKLVIDGIEKNESVKDFLIVVAIAVVFQLIMYVVKLIGKYQMGYRLEYVVTRLEIARVKKIHAMDYEFLESQKMQDMIARAEDGAKGIYNFYGKIYMLGFRLLKTFFACAIIFTASPWMILVVVGFSIGRYLLSDRTNRWIKEHIDNQNIEPRRKKKYYNSVTKDFKYGKDIRLFQMADLLQERLKKAQNQIYERTNKGRYRRMLADDASMTLDLFIQTGIMYAWMVYEVLFRGMSIGNFTLYLGSVKRFGGAISSVLSDYSSMRDINRRVNDFRMFMEHPDTMEQSAPEMPLPKAQQYEFVFEHVWFCYPGQEEYALKDVCLTIEAGKRLAVVGLNGAGKSTFIKLLCRLYRPTKGTIKVNGVDIWQIEQQQYFEILAPIFQNVECYAATLAENVSLQRLEDTDQKTVETCVAQAGLSKKLDILPNGVRTQLLRFLHDDGVDLSGGEKQKLSLARALYKAAKKDASLVRQFPAASVFVLDEPTANLDALAEYAMYSNFDQLIGNHTAIYISHRLSSTRFCHHVALFESGRVREYGTHQQLLEKQGSYARLYEVQARYYREQEEGEKHE